MTKKLYHYGTPFSKDQFSPIRNHPEMIQNFKPFGGFWCSWEDSYFGWADWCRREDFHLENLTPDKKSFYILKNDAKVLVIDSVAKAKALPKRNRQMEGMDIDSRTIWTMMGQVKQLNLDYEKIADEYDVIDFRISHDSGLYDAMYTWDCDSVLVMNPDVLKEVSEEA